MANIYRFLKFNIVSKNSRRTSTLCCPSYIFILNKDEILHDKLEFANIHNRKKEYVCDIIVK